MGGNRKIRFSAGAVEKKGASGWMKKLEQTNSYKQVLLGESNIVDLGNKCSTSHNEKILKPIP